MSRVLLPPDGRAPRTSRRCRSTTTNDRAGVLRLFTCPTLFVHRQFPDPASLRRSVVRGLEAAMRRGAPAVGSNAEPLDLIVAAIEQAGYAPGREIGIALDPASSGFFEDGVYRLRTEDVRLDSTGLVQRYRDFVAAYPIVAIEDGLAEDDWTGWRHLTATLGDRIELIGDDILVTNVGRIQRGIEEETANSVLIKPNQIGTLTETVAAVGRLAAAS